MGSRHGALQYMYCCGATRRLLFGFQLSIWDGIWQCQSDGPWCLHRGIRLVKKLRKILFVCLQKLVYDNVCELVTGAERI